MTYKGQHRKKPPKTKTTTKPTNNPTLEKAENPEKQSNSRLINCNVPSIKFKHQILFKNISCPLHTHSTKRYTDKLI